MLLKDTWRPNLIAAHKISVASAAEWRFIRFSETFSEKNRKLLLKFLLICFRKAYKNISGTRRKRENVCRRKDKLSMLVPCGFIIIFSTFFPFSSARKRTNIEEREELHLFLFSFLCAQIIPVAQVRTNEEIHYSSNILFGAKQEINKNAPLESNECWKKLISSAYLSFTFLYIIDKLLALEIKN